MGSLSGRSPLFALLIAVSFLVGCAQVPRQAFNAKAAPHVKSLVITQSVNQEEYGINILGHPGMSFGLIGGLVAAADMQMKTTRLTKAIDAGETRLQERFGRRLVEKLSAIGYESRVVALPKDTKQDQALVLAKQQQGGDAALLIEVSGGYWAAGPSTDYFPRVVARVRAVDTKSEKVLYEDTISYGYAMPQAQTVHLASEPTYRFKNMDELVGDPAKTREGLYVGLDALAQQIASDLKKN